MKKSFLLLLLVSMISLACKKERTEESYEERLEGQWDLVAVDYNGTAPDPMNPGRVINFEGQGQNVQGGMEVNRDPNEVDYNFSFRANVSVSDTLPAFPFDIDESGSGTWTTTSDESTIIINGDTETYNFEVLTNEPDRQVLRTNITQTLFQILTVNSEVELEFVKQ